MRSDGVLQATLAVLALAALPSGSASGQSRPGSDLAHARIDSMLRAIHERGWFDGALVAGRGGSVVYARGFGFADVAAGAPFTTRTTSDGASVAKTFTAAAVFMLHEDGLLGLGDPVQRFLPEYPYAGTTVAHLITHSAGALPDYDYFWEFVGPDEVLTNERLLAVLAEQRPPLSHAPGVLFEYSSTGSDLAALIVERASGQSYESFLAERIFRPLGMETVFVRPGRFADWPGVRTLSYRRAGDSLVVHDIWDREGFYGGSNLYLSAEDLYRWVASFAATPVLDDPTLARGLGPARLNAGQATGINLLSWYTSPDQTRFAYPGVLQGFYSVGYWDTDGDAVAFVTNTNMPSWLRGQLTAAVVSILETGTHRPLVPPENEQVASEDLHAIARAYPLDSLRTARIAVDGEAAYVSIEGGIRYRMFQADDGAFYVPGLDAGVTFALRRDDRLQVMRWRTAFEQIDAARIE